MGAVFFYPCYAPNGATCVTVLTNLYGFGKSFLAARYRRPNRSKDVSLYFFSPFPLLNFSPKMLPYIPKAS
jgi:hypothetical protein